MVQVAFTIETPLNIPRCYFLKDVQVTTLQLHGFSDASEGAYAGVVYLRMEDSDGNVHVTLVASKTRVAPIKHLSIPRLELCGAHLLTKLLSNIRSTLSIPIKNVMAWTDSTIVINWLDGSPRKFKTYVSNRISFIISHIPPKYWNHVRGKQNPADCASRGLYPEELIGHNLWWHGPAWLRQTSANWPRQICHLAYLSMTLGKPVYTFSSRPGSLLCRLIVSHHTTC